MENYPFDNDTRNCSLHFVVLSWFKSQLIFIQHLQSLNEFQHCMLVNWNILITHNNRENTRSLARSLILNNDNEGAMLFNSGYSYTCAVFPNDAHKCIFQRWNATLAHILACIFFLQNVLEMVEFTWLLCVTFYDEHTYKNTTFSGTSGNVCTTNYKFHFTCDLQICIVSATHK